MVWFNYRGEVECGMCFILQIMLGNSSALYAVKEINAYNESHKLIDPTVLQNGDIDLGQYWLRWSLIFWRHPSTTITNVDFSSAMTPGAINVHGFSRRCPRMGNYINCLAYDVIARYNKQSQDCYPEQREYKGTWQYTYIYTTYWNVKIKQMENRVLIYFITRNWRIPSFTEFHGTARVIEIGAFQVPWNSMELLLSAKLAHSK